jgi:16S rRNA (guanine966-N2)-methyltransferase
VPDAGRVVAGPARSVRLEAPGEGTRPLADRVKQTLFAILEPDLRGATFLDLFAGSGAAGIEALSRGAAHATFVERDAGAIRTIKANLQRTGLAERATVTRSEVLAWLRDPARAAEVRRYVAFLDPPY